jgi:glycosyltransferase involved in cell wall biosynthesis
VDKAAVQSMDDEMTRKADIVFVSSTPLYEGKAHIAREIIFSPHGVDIDHFSRSSAMADGVPEDIKSLNKPILGFWGLIEERIDLDLIKYLATRNPEWNFVLIGHVAVKDNPCSEVANVHFLGPKKYDELPSYGKLFDVALLPYKLNDFVFNCNPIKLREYLATGCPVVSTRYPEIEKYQEVASIADDYASFEGMIWWHLANDSQEMFDQRINRIKAESWQNRCNEIVAKLKLKFGLEGGAV